MLINYEDFFKLFPHSIKFDEPDDGGEYCFYNGLSKAMTFFSIVGKEREGCFLAQCAYESSGFSKMHENMNYSDPKRIHEIWPSKFPTIESAKVYVNNPKMLASYVYADKNGNGSAASQDGYKYRGYGPLQLTWKSQHDDYKYFKLCNIKAETYPLAFSAAWFWDRKNLNLLADRMDMSSITKTISGVDKTLPERLEWLKKIEEYIK